MCSIKLKLFRSALGVGKIMRDPAPHVAHGRKTLQMCGSKIIPAFDLKGFIRYYQAMSADLIVDKFH